MSKNYIDGLSIVIPSYNRKEQLCRLLDGIFKEDLVFVIEIVVVDNCSNYNIYDVLEHYSSQKLRIVRNPFNVRMATNMMNTFLHCKTKWMWLISDDDLICNNAISTIINKINENPDVGYLKFSTDGIGSVGCEIEKKVHNLEQFIDYYADKDVVRSDNLVFVSNGVFNLNALYPFLGYGFEFSYTYIGFLIPVFFSLNDKIPVKFCNEKVIKFVNPGKGVWSFTIVGLGLSTISHLPFSLSKMYSKKFLKITMPISYIKMFEFLLTNKVPRSRFIYSLIYQNSYKNYLGYHQKVFYHLLSIILICPKFGNFLLKKYRS